MLKNEENNVTEELGLVTPTPGLDKTHHGVFALWLKSQWCIVFLLLAQILNPIFYGIMPHVIPVRYFYQFLVDQEVTQFCLPYMATQTAILIYMRWCFPVEAVIEPHENYWNFKNIVPLFVYFVSIYRQLKAVLGVWSFWPKIMFNPMNASINQSINQCFRHEFSLWLNAYLWLWMTAWISHSTNLYGLKYFMLIISSITGLDTWLCASFNSILHLMEIEKEILEYIHYFISYMAYGSINDARWRHQMETFSAILAICAGNSPVPGEFPTQRPVTRSFDVFFDLRLNKHLSKQSWGWSFETLSRPLCRHRNGWKRWSSHIEVHLLAHPDHILQMTSQSIADDITNTRQLWCEHNKSNI